MNRVLRFSIKFFSVVLISIIGLSSCSTSNDVASNGLIQKRKHRKGYHLNIGKRVNDTRVAEKSSSENELEASSHPVETEVKNYSLDDNSADDNQSVLAKVASLDKPELRKVRKELKRDHQKQKRLVHQTNKKSRDDHSRQKQFMSEEDGSPPEDPISLISLALGLASIGLVAAGFVIFFPISMVGLAMAIAAIVTGVIGRGAYATIGIIAGVLAILLWLLVIVAAFIFLALLLL